jgi:chromosome segregation ATPase
LDALTEFRADADKRFDAIHDDLTVNLARSDRSDDKTRSLRSEMRHMQEEIAALTRNQRHLTAEVEAMRNPPN